MTRMLPQIKEVRQALAACLRRTKDAEHRRALVVLHLVAGGQVQTVEEVAERVDEDPKTVAAWLERYRSAGIAAFSTHETREVFEAGTGTTERAADRSPVPPLPTISRAPIGDVRVVLGEADDLVARIIEAKLEREGLDVRRSRDGAELVSVLEEASPDLVLVDVRLAGLDGFQVTRWIRDHERLSATPVILLGWPGKETDVVDAFDAGADDYVLKPFSPIDLFARAQRLVDRRVARRLPVHG